MSHLYKRTHFHLSAKISNIHFNNNGCCKVKIIEQAEDFNRIFKDVDYLIYEKHLKSGDKLFAIEIDGKIVARCFSGTGPRFIRGCGYLLDISEIDVYEYWVEVDSGLRGKSLYSQLFAAQVNYFSNIGCNRFHLLIESGNNVMFHIKKKQNFSFEKKITSLVIGKFAVLFIKDYKLNLNFIQITSKYQKCLSSI